MRQLIELSAEGGRRCVAFCLVLLCVQAAPGSVSPGGGSDDIVLQPRMGDPLQELNDAYNTLFLAGLNDFVLELQPEDGLGPVFNKENCGNCHNNPVGGAGSQTVTRFGYAGEDGFDPLADYGGSLLQSQSISEACAEQIPAIANVTSLRITNGALGYGLIEAIADADILALEQPAPGISGRAHMVEAFEAPGVPRVGRFGWKAQVPTILTFSADAALNEMGLTNRFVTEENDPNGIYPPSLDDCDDMPDPEDGPDDSGRDFIDRVTDFQRYLAPPPQTPRSGMSGEGIFNTIGCVQCHHASFTTTDTAPEEFLRNRTIRPYSDFLLHDIGLAADFIAQGDAGERELRTPPLWGVRRRDPIWHDGRFEAGTFAERITLAIEEHGLFLSEAVDVIANWNALPGGNQQALIAFLDSLGKIEFDLDGDDGVDVDDFILFTDCFGGSFSPDDPCAVADLNQDGDIDETDFSGFLEAYDGTLEDCDGDGELDLVEILLGGVADTNNNGIPDECENPCPADLDGSGDVGFQDLLPLLSAWGPCSGPCPEDINGNGAVDFGDVLQLLSAWGPC